MIIVVLSIVLNETNPQSNPPVNNFTPTQGSLSPVIPSETTYIEIQTSTVQPDLIPDVTTPTASNTDLTILTNIPAILPTLFVTPTILPIESTATSTLPPTVTPTSIPQTSTPATPCYQIGDLEDVTIPAGSEITAGQTFTKIWGFYNTGSCTWEPNYSLVLTSGSLIYPYHSVQLGEYISPGMVWQISIDVTAPNTPGVYYDTWVLNSEGGQALIDENGQEFVFSILITVLSSTPTPPAPASITGRIIKDGIPVGPGISLALADLSSQTIFTTTTIDDGTFSWTKIPASDQGYNVIFSQGTNDQYGMDQVLSWVWIGPIPVQDGDVIRLMDIDISRLGFDQISPGPEAVFSAAAISPENPITFLWTGYPEAIDYWVDLVRGEEENVWQSQLIQAQSISFDGTLADGTHIQPDEYWWAVGARRLLGPYTQFVYTYLTSISIEY